MQILSCIGIALLTTIAALVLRRHYPDGALIVSLTGGAVLLMQTIRAITSIYQELEGWMDRVSLEPAHFSILWKAAGICLLTQFAIETCRDAKENALASKLEFAGRCAVILLALPLFRDILSIILELTGGTR